MRGTAVIDSGPTRALTAGLMVVGVLGGAAGIRGLTNDGHLFSRCQSEDWAHQFRASVEDVAARTDGAILRSRQAKCARNWAVTLRLRGADGASVVDAAVGSGWQVTDRKGIDPFFALLERQVDGQTVRLVVRGRADHAVLAAYIPVEGDD